MYKHLTVCKQMTDVKLNCLVSHSNTWNHLIVGKQISFGLFKMLTTSIRLQIIYLIYV